MNKPIGGSLDTASLAKLNAPAHHAQVEHARHHARSALSALHAIDACALTAGEHERLSRIAATLADVIEALEGRHHA